MIQKDIRYTYENTYPVFLIDYMHFNGSNEHSFQLSLNGKIEKHIILDRNVHEFLNKFKTKEQMAENETPIKTNSWKEMQELLFKSMKEVKEGNLEPQKGLVIAKLGDTLVNSTKIEILSKMNKVYPQMLM